MKWHWSLLTFLLLAPLHAETIKGLEERQQRGAMIAQDMMAAIKADLFNKGRYLRFDYALQRENERSAAVRHLWDRQTGQYRVDWLGENQLQLVAVFDVKTGEGNVWANGEAMSDAQEKEFLKAAYDRYVNDSFILLAPFALLDPHVELLYLSTQKLDKDDYDVVHISFTKESEQFGKQYWAYINRKTHLVDMSAMVPKGEPAPSLEKAVKWRWTNWADIGTGALVSRERTRLDVLWKIRFPVAGFLSSVDPLVFRDPAARIPDVPEPRR